MLYLSNSFSLNMINNKVDFSVITVKKIKPEEIPVNVRSIVGHADFADILSAELGFKVEHKRETVELCSSDILFLAQYKGPRLPEGTTKIPEGAKIQYYKIELSSGCRGCGGPDYGGCSNCSQMEQYYGR